MAFNDTISDKEYGTESELTEPGMNVSPLPSTIIDAAIIRTSQRTVTRSELCKQQWTFQN